MALRRPDEGAENPLLFHLGVILSRHWGTEIDISVTAVIPSVVVDHNDVEWQPCHCGRGSGREQPGECAGDSHDGGWRWDAPLRRVAWSRLDPCTGTGTVLFGSVLHLLSQGAHPALVSQALARGQVVRVLRAS